MTDNETREIDPYDLSDDQSDEVTRIVNAEIEARTAITQWRRLMHGNPSDLLARLIAIGWQNPALAPLPADTAALIAEARAVFAEGEFLPERDVLRIVSALEASYLEVERLRMALKEKEQA
mgnify:CR=1 FL=1